MILHKIQLRGFLSHRGTPDASVKSGFAWTELDFSRSSLWLIHGENGAGKSTIFDAIYFALYKRARGKGQGSQNQGFLIHHDADRAEVRLFLEIGGRKYRVERAIKRKVEAGKATPDSAVYDGWDDGVKMLPDTKNKVETWAKNELRMDADTFAYAVLLRQGDTDAFLKAEASERKSCLLQLLDLGEFEKLGEAAGKEHAVAKNAVKDALKRLEGVAPLAPDALEDAQKALADAQTQVELERDNLDAATLARDNGLKARDWETQIARLNARNQSEQQLLAREAEIVERVQRGRELNRVLPPLLGVWQAQRRLDDEENLLSGARKSAGDAQTKSDGLAARLAAFQDETEAAQKAETLAHSLFEKAQKIADDAREEALTARDIEDLERAIRVQNDKLVSHQRVLDRAPTIEAAFARWTQLQGRLPKLEALTEALEAEKNARRTFDEHQAAHEEFGRRAQDLADQAEGAQVRLSGVQGHRHAAIEELAELKSRFEVLKTCSDLRKQVEGEDLCPFCGSSLCDPTTSGRLEAERDEWNQEARKLKDQRKAQEERVEALTAQETAARKAWEAADKTARKAENDERQAHADLGHAQNRVVEKAQFVAREQKRCLGFAHDWQQLPQLQAEFEALDGAEEQHQKLLAAQQIEVGVRAAREVHEERLALLPYWTAPEREAKREAQTEAADALKACKTKLDTAQKTLGTKQTDLRALEAKASEAASDLANKRSQVADLETRCEREEKGVSVARQKLDGEEPWRTHPALLDWAKFEALQDESDALFDAETEAAALDEARKNALLTQGERAGLQCQLEALPALHRGPMPELEAELGTVRAAWQNARDAQTKAQHHEREVERGAQERHTRENDLRAGEKEAAIAGKLAVALGKTGLQSTIQRNAQDKLKAEANKVLGRLTEHQWAIHLEEMSDDRLEIWADDHRTGRHVQFEYISGGERMRIAVALAVAIGQSVTGGAPMKSLIIDEGFGALDEPNRKRMVEELKRLSQDEFGGGRVIVISHQDDVCDGFTHRFHIERDKNGQVCATPFPSLLKA